MQMRIAIRWTLPAVIAIILIASGATEFAHYRRFGHFVGYGFHADVVLGDSDIGTHDMHFARVLSMSPVPSYLEGCIEVATDSARTVPHWDSQKWDPLHGRWVSRHSWVANPPGRQPYEVPCHLWPIIFAPFQSRNVAWAFGAPGTKGQPERIAIYTSVHKPPEMQRIIYTETFVDQPDAKSGPQQR